MNALRNATVDELLPEATTDNEKRWYGRYKTLFGPGAPLPSSPYYTGSHSSGLGSDIIQGVSDLVQSFIAQGHPLRLAQTMTTDEPEAEVLAGRFAQLLGEFRRFAVERRQQPETAAATPGPASLGHPAPSAPPPSAPPPSAPPPSAPPTLADPTLHDSAQPTLSPSTCFLDEGSIFLLGQEYYTAAFGHGSAHLPHAGLTAYATPGELGLGPSHSGSPADQGPLYPEPSSSGHQNRPSQH